MAVGQIGSRTQAFAFAVAIVSVVNLVLVWAKETRPALKNLMAAALGHHWLTHGAVLGVLFVLVGLFLTRAPVLGNNWGQGGRLAVLVAATVLLSAIGITGYFVLAR